MSFHLTPFSFIVGDLERTNEGLTCFQRGASPIQLQDTHRLVLKMVIFQYMVKFSLVRQWPSAGRYSERVDKSD